MKQHILILLLTIPCLVFGQTPRSEIVKYRSYNQIKGDRLIREDSVILQINERMGDHDAEIHIPYSKGDKLSIGEAWIEDMAGNIVRKLKGKEIEDRSQISNISLYEDDFEKSFELKHNSYPYRIVYSYKITFSKFISAAAINHRNSRKPVKDGHIVVETSLDRPIAYKQENVDNPVIDTINNITRYTWAYSYAPIARETNTSRNSSDAPIIHAIPLKFKFGTEGSVENWQMFGNWIYKLNEGRDMLTASEQEKINTLIKDARDDYEKVKVLYKYMQDYTRYINVSINIGGFQTYPASYVCVNRYGDCKALTNYMQSMLKYIGIKSYYTLIYAGDRIIDTDLNFPSQVFNHVILTVPLANDTIYLECTSKNIPLGYMGTFTQGRKALLVDQDKSRFIDIPSLKPDDVLCSRSFLIDMNTSEVKLTATERGDNYERSLYLVSDVSKNTVDKYIRNNILSGSFDLHDFKFRKENPDSAKIEMDLECKMHNLYKEYGNNIVITPFSIDIPSYESPDKRKTDVQLDYPEYYQDEIIYQFSNDKKIKKPENISVESKYGKYSIMYQVDENKLVVKKTILIYQGRYNQEEYKDFYDFITGVKNNEIKKLYLETR